MLDLKVGSKLQLLKRNGLSKRDVILKTYDIGVKTKTLTIDETQTFSTSFHMAEEKAWFQIP